MAQTEHHESGFLLSWLQETLDIYPKVDNKQTLTLEEFMLSSVTNTWDIKALRNRVRHKTAVNDLNISKVCKYQYKFTNNTTSLWELKNLEYITKVNDNIHKPSAQRQDKIWKVHDIYCSENFVCFPTFFNEAFKILEVKEIYQMLKEESGNDPISAIWNIHGKNWTRLIEIRRSKTKYLDATIKRHGQNLLYQRLEPIYYSCAFCKENASWNSWGEKFDHSINCDAFQRIWEKCVTVLNLPVNTRVNKYEICFGLNVQDLNISTISTKEFKNMCIYIKLHWCIWRNRKSIHEVCFLDSITHEMNAI